MNAYPCGHSIPSFIDLKLRCAVYGCSRRPRVCVTYSGLGISDYPTYRIEGACRWHRRRVVAMLSRDTTNNGDFAVQPADLAMLVEKCHATGLCHSHAISVTDTTTARLEL